MKTTGKILILPGVFEAGKKVSAFKTISFLVSSPESEPAPHSSTRQNKDERNHAEVPGPLGD